MFLGNKAVVGSGSEGIPKYMGVTYGVFLWYFYIFSMCTPPDAVCQGCAPLTSTVVTQCLIVTSQTYTDDVMS